MLQKKLVKAALLLQNSNFQIYCLCYTIVFWENSAFMHSPPTEATFME